jgi:hypothetical protein
MRTAALKLPIDLLYNHNRKGYERNLELGERLDSLAGAGKYSEDIEPDLMQKDRLISAPAQISLSLGI